MVETPIASGVGRTPGIAMVSALWGAQHLRVTPIATMHCAAEATGAPRRARYTPLGTTRAKLHDRSKNRLCRRLVGNRTKSGQDAESGDDHVAPEDADVIIALGGDGHMLETLHAWLDRDVPIYGINRGTVGFR